MGGASEVSLYVYCSIICSIWTFYSLFVLESFWVKFWVDPEYFVNQLLEASLAMKYVREFVYNVMIFGQPYTIQYNDIVATQFLVWTHQTHCYYSRPHEMLINNSNLLISHIALWASDCTMHQTIIKKWKRILIPTLIYSGINTFRSTLVCIAHPICLQTVGLCKNVQYKSCYLL